jgi:hypothetical protein
MKTWKLGLILSGCLVMAQPIQAQKFNQQVGGATLSNNQFDKSKVNKTTSASVISRLSRTDAVGSIEGGKCKIDFLAQRSGLERTLATCIDKVNTDFDALTNSQLVSLCGSKPMQQCYEDYFNTGKKRCEDDYREKLTAAVAQLSECVATEKHVAKCPAFANSVSRLGNAAKELADCSFTAGSESELKSWCEGLTAGNRKQAGDKIEEGRRTVKACVEKIKKF